MKKLLCVFLVMVLLASMVVPVSAKDSVVTFYASENMTEQEFRTQEEEVTVFRLRQTRSFNSKGPSEKGYYYNNLLKQPDNTALLGYTIASSGYSWAMAASLNRKAWVSKEHISLKPMLGCVYGSQEFYANWDYYSQLLLAGIWACRYDNPAAFERYTTMSNVDVKISYNSATQKVVAFDVYAVMEDHAAYQDKLIVARDKIVKQVAAKANKKGSQVEALRYIHNYLILNAEYDNRKEALYDAYSDTDAFYYGHTAIGVLNKGLGVCESYAKAFKLICDSLKNAPECVIVVSSEHMWNAVRLDGKWYCVDATWDDGGGDKVKDTYFLCGDPDIVDGDSTEHIPMTDYGPTPKYAEKKYGGHTHAIKKISQVAATETATGVKAHYKCSGCGKLFADAKGKTETTQKALKIAKLPKAPSVSVKNVAGGVQISWKAVSKAEKYYVYRRTSSKSAWKRIKTTNKTTYVDTKAASGSKYQYAVKAVNGAAVSGYSKVATIRFLASAKVTVKNVASGIKASWNKVTGATGYTVYRRQKTTSGWSSWKKLGNTKSRSYTDKKATAGVQYQYAVKAYSGSVKSDLVASATVCILATPKASLAKHKSGIKVSWKKIKGAEKYVVYRSQLKGKKWSGYKKIGTTTKVSFVDKTVKSKVSYKYYVVAVSGSSQSSHKVTSALKYTVKK